MHFSSLGAFLNLRESGVFCMDMRGERAAEAYGLYMGGDKHVFMHICERETGAHACEYIVGSEI